MDKQLCGNVRLPDLVATFAMVSASSAWFSKTASASSQASCRAAITNVRWIDIGLTDSPALVYCDIGTGAVKAHWPLVKDRPTENAKAGGDGDLDIVAASLLSAEDNRKLESLDTSSVVMLLQTSPGEFKRTKGEGRTHHHISLETGDFNDDGRVDFAVGTFLREGGLDQPDLVIWWNES